MLPPHAPHPTSYPGDSKELRKGKRVSVVLLEGYRRQCLPLWPRFVEKICLVLLIWLAIWRFAFFDVNESNSMGHHTPHRGSASVTVGDVSEEVVSISTPSGRLPRKPSIRKPPKIVDPLDELLAQKALEAESKSNEEIKLGHSNNKYREDGMVEVDSSSNGKHIIFDLIANATEQHKLLRSSSPKDLNEATTIYQAAFNRPPPENYARLAPLFPSPPTSLLPYHSLSKSKLQSDVLLFESSVEYSSEVSKNNIFIFVVDGEGKFSAEFPFGEEAVKEEAEMLVENLREFEGLVGALRLAVDVTGRSFPQITPFEISQQRLKAALDMKIEELTSDFPETSLSQVCDPESPYRKPFNNKKEEEAAALKAKSMKAPEYIFRAIPSTDICLHPHLVKLSPTLAWLTDHAKTYLDDKRTLRPIPILTPYKLSVSSNILAPFISMSNLIEEGIDGDEEEKDRIVIPWEKKSGSRVAQWRGDTLSFGKPPPSKIQDGKAIDKAKPRDWYHSSPNYAQENTRWRLNLLKFLPLPKTFPKIVAPDFGKSEGFQLDSASGTAVWDEMGLINVAMNSLPECIGWDGCTPLKSKIRLDPVLWKAAEEKFIFVVEEESPREIFLGGSVVLQVGITQAPWMIKAIPWFHYVPIQADFSDLPSIMMFFRKYPQLAKEIANHGRDFALEQLSFTQEKKEFLGLLLEYSRIWNDER